METIVLKVPPERVAAMADAIDRDLAAGAPDGDRSELEAISAWLRYRHTRYTVTHPDTPAG